MTNSMIEESRQAWGRIRPEVFARYAPFAADGRLDLSRSEINLTTDDFMTITVAFAHEIGIDLASYGRKLVGVGAREDLLAFYAGVALRTIFEVEGHYVEIPNALTISKVPTQFLIVLGAALIGIATSRVAEINPILSGTVGGVGSLLINILAARFVQSGTNPVNWREEFILKLMEGRGEVTARQLHSQAKLYTKTIRNTLDSLHEKGLVDKQLVEVQGKKKRETRYLLRKSSSH